MKRFVFAVLILALIPGCAVWYLNILATKCAQGNMKEGEVASGNTNVRVVCKDGKLQRYSP